MKKIIIATSLMLLLAGCGDGGDKKENSNKSNSNAKVTQENDVEAKLSRETEDNEPVNGYPKFKPSKQETFENEISEEGEISYFEKDGKEFYVLLNTNNDTDYSINVTIIENGKVVQNKVENKVEYKIPTSDDYDDEGNSYINTVEYGFDEEGNLLIAENTKKFEDQGEYNDKTSNSSIVKVFNIQEDGSANLVREKEIDKYAVNVQDSMRGSYFQILLVKNKYSKDRMMSEEDIHAPIRILDSEFNVAYEHENLWNYGSDTYSADLKRGILFYGQSGQTKFYDLNKKEFVTKPDEFENFINADNTHFITYKGTDDGFYILYRDFYDKNKNRNELAYYKYKGTSAKLIASCFVETELEDAQSILSLQKDTITLNRIKDGKTEKAVFPRID